LVFSFHGQWETALMDRKPTREELDKKTAERGHVDKALHSAHQKLRATFDSIQDIINVVDLDFNLTDANEVLIKAFGLPDKKSALGRKCFEVLKGRKDICPNCAVAEAYQTKAAAYRTSTPEDDVRTGGRRFEIFAYPILDEDGNLSGAVEFARDITERTQLEEALKRAHNDLEQKVRKRTAELASANEQLKREIEERKRTGEALREQRNLFESILAATPDILVLKDRNSVYQAVNPAFCRFIGKKEEEIIGKTDFDLFPHDEAVMYRRDDAKVMETGEQQIQDEESTGEKGKRWLQAAKAPLPDETGKTIGVLCSVRDISDRKWAEEALRKAEEEKANILETMSELVVYVDTNMKILWANRAATESAGMTINALVGSYCYKEWFQRSEPCPFCPAKKILETGEPQEGETYSPDGRAWHFRGYPFKDENGDIIGIVEVVEEITKRKQAEEEKEKLQSQLQQAQKMKAIGTLAGGIAHDFNNLLMAIQGRTSLMLLHTGSDHADFEHLEGIKASVARGADLTRQLLGFARGGKYEVKPTDLNVLIEKHSEMFGRTKKEIRMHKKYQQAIWPVEVDRGQLEQVLLNLYVNAWQAMPGGGDLYIETSNVVLDKDYAKPFDVKPGNYVEISVNDTGVGMGETTQQRIFDPFFTTKEMGRGTGLGLASAYGIIKNHGGIITVYSEQGKGTTFNIYLPASGKKVAIEKKKPAEAILKGSGTVLFVDDEDVVIYVGKKMLKEIGYKVLPAVSGKEAVEVYEEHKDEIDLVILDVIMPGMSGGEVYDRIKEINPDIKVLLSSGYSVEGRATEILERGCNGFIQKPFDIEVLSHKIRETLEKE
jgi:two-component system cell cycle sensor histidine kinase/response regulator CckA